MANIADRIYAATATVGTGTVTFGSAVSGYRTDTGNMTDGYSYDYLLLDNSGASWEVGTGVYTAASHTLTRPGPGTDANFESSTGSLLSLTGSAQVAVVANRNTLAQKITGTTNPGSLVYPVGTVYVNTSSNAAFISAGGGTWISLSGSGASINVRQAGSIIVSGLTDLNFLQGASVAAAGTEANVTIPTNYFGTGAPGISGTPSLDATATGQWSGTSSGTVTLTTTQTNDVVVLLIGCEQDAALQTVSSVTSAHLTFTRRGGFNGVPGSGNNQSFEIWWAPSAGILTSEVITITLSGATGDAAVVAFSVHGAGSITSPWDTGSLPVITTGNPAAAPVFTTLQSNDFIFAATFNGNTGNLDTSAWTTLANVSNGGGTHFATISSFYEIVSTAQTGVSASLTSGNSNLKIRLVDAITGNITTTYVDGDRYYDTSITPFGSYVYKSGAWHQTGLVGYVTGEGSAVTQATSRTTGVTINTLTGAITMFSAAGSATAATFTVTNSNVAATDTVVLNQKSGTNLYIFSVTSVSAGAFNITFYTTGGTATDAPVINFNVIKGAAS